MDGVQVEVTNAANMNPNQMMSGTNTANQNYNANPGNAQNNKNANNNPSNKNFFEKMMSCFTISGYKQYFDVDTVDIKDRIVASLTHFNIEGGFRESVLERNGSGPDLYGPFWVATTLVFFVAVSSNLSMYLHSDSSADFEYDVAHIGRAMGIIYSFIFVLPTVLFFAFNCLSISIPLVDLMCLYGYSLVPYLPASLLCAIPLNFSIWIVLVAATGISMIFVLRNVVRNIMAANSAEGSSLGRKKDGPVFGTLMGCHIVFLLALKFSFYHHHYIKKATGAAETTDDGVEPV